MIRRVALGRRAFRGDNRSRSTCNGWSPTAANDRAPGLPFPSDLEGRPLAMMLHQNEAPVTGAHRPPCDCAEHLRRIAPEQATGSRDFGRGFLHAARTLERRAA